MPPSINNDEKSPLDFIEGGQLRIYIQEITLKLYSKLILDLL